MSAQPEPEPPEPPQNIDAEQALLGALMLNSDVLSRCGGLRADHFYDPVHGRIFAAAAAAISDGRPASPSLLAPLFADDPGLAEIGGTRYLARLCGGAISIFNASDFAKAILDAARRRSLVEACEAGVSAARDMAARTDDTIAAVESSLMVLEESATDRSKSMFGAMAPTITEIVRRYAADEDPPGVRSGWSPLDKLTGPLGPGQLTVLGGRPGSGKTTVALAIARQVAQSGRGVHFASLEMGQEEIAARMASLEMWAQHKRWCEYERIMSGRLDDGEARLLLDIPETLKGLPLRIGAQRSKMLGSIAIDARASARQLGEDAPLGLLIVDHLGYVRAPRERQNKVHEVGDVVRGLKDIGQSLGVAVLALCQLSRQVESRDDKRPVLSDLRDSGDIEQDADKVIFTYRPEYYLLQKPPAPGSDPGAVQDWHDAMDKARNRLFLGVAKNRQGSTGSAALWCDIAINAIREW